MKYREVHQTWPNSLADAGITYPDGVDIFSKQPFRCVSKLNMYLVEDKNIIKVLVVLPKTYRTSVWPFGNYKTIVLTAENNIQIVAENDIIELKYKIIVSDSDDIFTLRDINGDMN